MALTFYRIVKANPPSTADFTSKLAMGLVDPAADQNTRWLESGISAYGTEAQARRKARAFSFLGAYIAAVEIPEGGPITYRRTTSSAGHHTLWGDPSELAARVIAVVPVR